MNRLCLVLAGALVVGCGSKPKPAKPEPKTTTSPRADQDSSAKKGGGDSVQTEVRDEAGGTVHLGTVYFDFDSAELRPDARDELARTAGRLKANRSTRLIIEGHCDERGTTEYNIALGDRRAHAIRTYLARLGIDEARLSVISYGEERPADDGSDETAWAKNRRGELVPP